MKLKTDFEGKLITMPYSVRGTEVTAYAEITNGTNTTLLESDTDYGLDLVEINFANTSTGAVTIQLKNDGTVIKNYRIGAIDNTHFTYPIPAGQTNTSAKWDVDMEDVTGTTVYVDAIFIKCNK